MSVNNELTTNTQTTVLEEIPFQGVYASLFEKLTLLR